MSARSAASPPAVEPAGWSFGPVVDALCLANGEAPRGSRGRRPLPSRDAIADVVRGLRSALFPWHLGAANTSEQGLAYTIGRTLDAALGTLEQQVRIALEFERGSEDASGSRAERAREATRTLARRLPTLRALLGSDAQAAYEGDPAATSPDEVIFSYVGMTAITYHRIAHELYELGVPLIPRIVSELAHAATGIDIHPGARIGPRFFIDHGTGVVIGETCLLGEHVRLYQGVTLGANGFPSDARGNAVQGIRRHPVLQDGVVVYAGATILGPVTIGRGSSIGGNVWLTHSVPAGSQVSQARATEALFSDGAGI